MRRKIDDGFMNNLGNLKIFFLKPHYLSGPVIKKKYKRKIGLFVAFWDASKLEATRIGAAPGSIILANHQKINFKAEWHEFPLKSYYAFR